MAMKIDTKINVHNEFTIVVTDTKTKEKKIFKAYNVVLDKGLARLATGATYFTNISFGQGNATPNITDTALANYSGSKSASIVETVKDFTSNIFYVTKTVQLAPEEFVGHSFKEIAVAHGTVANISTRALIEDSEGNPISLPAKTETQVIDFYATVYFVPQYTTDLAGIMDGTFMNYMLAQSTSTFTTCGITLYPSYGNLKGSSSAKSSSFSNNTTTFTRTSGVMRWGVGDANWPVNALRLNGNIFEKHYPISGVWAGKQVEKVIANGDGVTTEFPIPYHSVDLSSVQMFLDAVETIAFTAQRDFTQPFSNATGDILPTSIGWGCSWSSDNTYLAVAHGASPFITIYLDVWKGTKVTFNTPPASPKAIKVRCNVTNVPKDSDHVFDVQYSIQFGRGV